MISWIEHDRRRNRSARPKTAKHEANKRRVMSTAVAADEERRDPILHQYRAGVKQK
jgi:hypothetical protein